MLIASFLQLSRGREAGGLSEKNLATSGSLPLGALGPVAVEGRDGRWGDGWPVPAEPVASESPVELSLRDKSVGSFPRFWNAGAVSAI